MGTHWLTGTQTPHPRSFSPTRACPAGDFQGCVFDEWGKEWVKGWCWKWIRVWPSCWGRAAKQEAPTTLLLKSLLHSLAEPWLYWGCSLPAYSLPKCHHLLRPSSRLYSPTMPCWAPRPLHLVLSRLLAYSLIQTTPRQSSAHSYCMSLLLCISLESTRRLRLSSLYHAPSEPPLYWPTTYCAVSL